MHKIVSLWCVRIFHTRRRCKYCGRLSGLRWPHLLVNAFFSAIPCTFSATIRWYTMFTPFSLHILCCDTDEATSSHSLVWTFSGLIVPWYGAEDCGIQNGATYFTLDVLCCDSATIRCNHSAMIPCYDSEESNRSRENLKWRHQNGGPMSTKKIGNSWMHLKIVYFIPKIRHKQHPFIK